MIDIRCEIGEDKREYHVTSLADDGTYDLVNADPVFGEIPELRPYVDMSRGTAIASTNGEASFDTVYRRVPKEVFEQLLSGEL